MRIQITIRIFRGAGSTGQFIAQVRRWKVAMAMLTLASETTANLIQLMLGVDAQWVVSFTFLTSSQVADSRSAWLALGHAVRTPTYRWSYGDSHQSESL
jgi:hypothetical protein